MAATRKVMDILLYVLDVASVERPAGRANGPNAG